MLEAELAFAIEAAQRAGERVLGLRATGRWKEEAMLADVADQAADGYLQGMLQGRFPGDAILSEETTDSPQRLASRRVWIVDPLDGTREYSQLRDDWAVHVALCVDGELALGVVALPAQQRVLWGRLGAQPSAGLIGSGLLTRGDVARNGRLRIAVSRSHTPSWMPATAQLLNAELVPSGSVGNKVALLLLGEADLYAHRKGLKEWDTAAPEVVARALGWRVTRFDGDEQRYNRPDPRNDEFIVVRPGNQAALMQALLDSGARAQR
jgi:3'(2'), 5'-bisphosphate nucleotidase